MKKIMSVNSFIGSLPKIPKLPRWEVSYNGQYRGIVRAVDIESAMEFIPVDRYPDREKISLTPLTRG